MGHVWAILVLLILGSFIAMPAVVALHSYGVIN
jgi:hypothetical protein